MPERHRQEEGRSEKEELHTNSLCMDDEIPLSSFELPFRISSSLLLRSHLVPSCLIVVRQYGANASLSDLLASNLLSMSELTKPLKGIFRISPPSRIRGRKRKNFNCAHIHHCGQPARPISLELQGNGIAAQSLPLLVVCILVPFDICSYFSCCRLSISLVFFFEKRVDRSRNSNNRFSGKELPPSFRIVEDQSEAPREESLRAGVGAFFEASSSVAEEEVT
ncbi:hypothetical protein Salat_0263500 [Sesamum alatum]|uniref:Uncharacterized protein n=1 Tax=Sesamum alatum TaxID=300844 RepID=A0AAE1YZN5_9LAMI|nr:hypothetical protein Salat_0263500 [Sesamum alatum]